MEVDRTVHAALHHRFNDRGAEPALLWPRHGRSLALDPAHSEGIAVGPPADLHATRIRRKRPVNRPIKPSTLPAAVWRAIACTRLSRFLTRWLASRIRR